MSWLSWLLCGGAETYGPVGALQSPSWCYTALSPEQSTCRLHKTACVCLQETITLADGPLQKEVGVGVMELPPHHAFAVLP